MSSGGGGGSTTTVQKADPWVGLQPALTQLYGGALDQYKSGGANYYPNSTVAPSNDAINSAIGGGINMATAGNQGQKDANWQNDYTINGGYTNTQDPNLAAVAGGSQLNSNPYLSQMYSAATDPLVSQFKNATAPALASQFSMAGRMGSNSHEAAFGQAGDSLGRGLADASAQIYGGNFEQERQRQMQAMQTLSSNRNFERGIQSNAIAGAPAYAQAQYGDMEKLMGIGQYQQQQQQQLIDADKARYDFGQNKGAINLQQLSQLLQGGAAYSGSTTSGQQSLNKNPFQSAMGGAAMGASIGSIVPGIGTGIGALGGLALGGLFG